MTLKYRFLFSFVAYTLLVLLFFGGAYYVLEKRAAIRAQEEEQLKSIEKVASVCRESYLASSAIVALNYINVVKKDPSVVFTACLDPRGLVQAHSDPQLIGRSPQDPASLRALGVDSVEKQSYSGEGGLAILEWDAPVKVKGAEVGLARVAYNRDLLEQAINRKLWLVLQKLILVAGSTFFVAVLISLVLAWSLSRPIGQLATAAREIGSGHLEYQAPTGRRSDELGYLGREINTMAQKLAELDNLKRAFIAMVTHDLKSPLSAVIGYITLVTSGFAGPVTEQQVRHLEVAKKAADRLARYINDILDVSKMEAGKFDIFRQPTDLAETIRSVLEIQRGSAEQMKVHFVEDVSQALPVVDADPEQLHRVVTNLISNAMKFTPENGAVRVLARVQDSQIRVEVKDSGPGIPESQLQSVFEKFFQVRETKAQASRKGTGLGLTIVKWIVTAHGGNVWAESKPNEGATFIFTIPVS